jgi:hypothetical protein
LLEFVGTTPASQRIVGEVGPPDVLVNTIGAFSPGDTRRP